MLSWRIRTFYPVAASHAFGYALWKILKCALSFRASQVTSPKAKRFPPLVDVPRLLYTRSFSSYVYGCSSIYAVSGTTFQSGFLKKAQSCTIHIYIFVLKHIYFHLWDFKMWSIPRVTALVAEPGKFWWPRENQGHPKIIVKPILEIKFLKCVSPTMLFYAK